MSKPQPQPIPCGCEVYEVCPQCDPAQWSKITGRSVSLLQRHPELKVFQESGLAKSSKFTEHTVRVRAQEVAQQAAEIQGFYNEFIHRLPPFFQGGGPIRVWAAAPDDLNYGARSSQFNCLTRFLRDLKLPPGLGTVESLAQALRGSFEWVNAVEVLDDNGNGVVLYNRWP